MLPEVRAAVNFLGRLLNSTGRVSKDSVEKFKNSLEHHLNEHYRGHWFPDMPVKGSGYRCIRINHYTDPIVTLAAKESDTKIALTHLPKELTVWIDPNDVSYRIGENGSIGPVHIQSNIPSNSDLIELSSDKSKSSPFSVMSCRDLMTPKRGNYASYAFPQMATFVTS